MIKLLSIQDRVSGWEQSFVCPPPLPIQRIVDHMGMRSYVSFCLTTSVWKDVKTFFELPPLALSFYLAFCALTFTGLNIFM